MKTVHPQTLHIQGSAACSQARNASHALGSSNTDCSVIFVRLKRICHLVRTCITLCCSLTCFALRAHLLRHASEHALRSGQHDLLQEHPVHHQPLQATPVEKHRYQEHTVVKIYRVTETCEQNTPQVMIPKNLRPRGLRFSQGSRG